MKRSSSTLPVLVLVLATLTLVPPVAPVAAAATARPIAAFRTVGNAGGTWTSKFAVPSARSDFAMALLGLGKVLLFGGWDGTYVGETWLATSFLTPVRVYLPLVVRNY